MQYRAGLPLDETIDGLPDLEGLAWMRELRGRDDVDWQAVDEVHRQWHEEALPSPSYPAIVSYLACTDKRPLVYPRLRVNPLTIRLRHAARK